MDVFLAAVAGAGSGHQPASAIAPGLGRALVKAIRAWGQRTQQPTAPAPVLYLGLASWSRLHGLISLEINGHLHATGIDAGLLYHAEVQALLAQAQLAQV
jgi:hypothetical protein